MAGAGYGRARTVSFVSAQHLEVADGHEASRIGHGRVASLVPVRVILPADHMEEVASSKTQFFGVFWVGFVVVERPNDLMRYEGTCQFAVS